MLTPLDNDDRSPHTEKELFPRPPKREDGSYVYDRVPDYCLPQKEKVRTHLQRLHLRWVDSNSWRIAIPVHWVVL